MDDRDYDAEDKAAEDLYDAGQEVDRLRVLIADTVFYLSRQLIAGTWDGSVTWASQMSPELWKRLVEASKEP